MMYQTATVALLASLMPLAQAHYFFDKLVVKGQASPDFVRSNTRQTAYMPTKWKNTFDNLTPDSIDFRCNLGATNKGSKATAKVNAGDDLAMTIGVGATFRHPGPAQVYMSKAPTTAGAYDGSGDWFKIHQETICKQGANIKEDAWCTWDKDRISFKIPQGIPDGDYLIRAEHIGLHGAHDGQAEFYYGCAQVTVSGGGNTTPTDTVKIPGVYKKTDPEVNFSVWGGNNVQYPAQGPGPKVFTGGASSSVPSTEKAPASGNTPSTPSTPAQQSPVPSAAAPSSAPSAPPKPAVPSSAPSAPPKPAVPSPAVPSTPSKPVPSTPTKPVPSAKPTKCGTYARRHARDMAN